MSVESGESSGQRPERSGDTLIAALVDRGAEASDLDFKATLDLQDTRSRAEFVKDVAAMSVCGGWLVVGYADDGTLIGIDGSNPRSTYDEAKLRNAVQKYVGTEIQLEVHFGHVEKKQLAAIKISPIATGFVIMLEDGAYGSKPDLVFRRGDVYVRHGTINERWNQDDARRIIDSVVRGCKELWWKEELGPAVATLQAGNSEQVLSRAAVGSLQWQIDAATLYGVVIEQIRYHDPLPVRRLLLDIRKDAVEIFTSDGVDADFRLLLDRLCVIGGAALFASERDLSRNVTHLLGDLYDLGLQAVGRQSDYPSERSARLWYEIARRVVALGALAVRLRDWSVVAELSTFRPSRIDADHYRSWIRHAVTMAARTAVSAADPDAGRTSQRWIVVAAEEDIARIAALRPDEPVGSEALQASVAQFDVACALSIIRVTDPPSDASSYEDFYPGFVAFDGRLAAPIIELIIADRHIAEELAVDDPDGLAAAIRRLEAAAKRALQQTGFWLGFGSPKIERFLADHPPRA